MKFSNLIIALAAAVSRASHTAAVEEFSDHLWISEDDNPSQTSGSLKCAEKDTSTGPPRIRSKDCDAGNNKQKWEIKKLQGFAFQIINADGKCVAVGKKECGTGSGAFLKMGECNRTNGDPNNQAAWYEGNTGTLNSYYCSFVKKKGILYISPRKDEKKWVLSNEPLRDNNGMFIFSDVIPGPTLQHIA